MPVHNGAAYLAETMDSLVDEADEGMEIILIDSTPDDTCLRIVDAYRDRLKLYYFHRPDIGPWQVKTNEAVHRARAPHIAMLHQDDVWLPGRVRAIRASMKATPDAAMYLFPSRFINSLGRDLGPWHCPLAGRKLWFGDELVKRLLVQNFVAIPAPIIRKHDWIAVGGLDEKLWYTADWDLYLKLAGRGGVAYFDRATTAFRVHGDSLTVTGSRNIEAFESQIATIVDRYGASVSDDGRQQVIRLAHASMAMNVALAAAADGGYGKMGKALLSILRLGPFDMVRYFVYSRIVERVFSRIRAGLAGRSRSVPHRCEILRAQRG